MTSSIIPSTTKMVFVKIITDGAAGALLGCNSDFEGQNDM
jgi:hypothetical protein